MQHLCRHPLLPSSSFPSSFSCKYHSLHLSLGLDGYPTANGNSIHFPAFYFDHLISLPCGNPIFYLRMGHIEARFTILLSIPSGSCLPKNISTHAHPVSRTIVRIEYVVMSFLSAPFSHNRLSLLPSMVACVYIQGIRFLRGFGFDWNHCYL